MYSKLICFFLSISTAVNAQVTSSGKCPSVSGAAGFEIEKFLGKWFLHAAYPNTFTEGDCIKVDYSSYVNGSFNDYIAKTVDGQTTYLVGNFKQSADDAATVLGEINAIPSGEVTTVSTTIVKIDYTGYMIIYNCNQISENEKQDVVWIFTRQVPLSDSSQAAVGEYITSNDYINPANLVLVSYDSCGNL